MNSVPTPLSDAKLFSMVQIFPSSACMRAADGIVVPEGETPDVPPEDEVELTPLDDVDPPLLDDDELAEPEELAEPDELDELDELDEVDEPDEPLLELVEPPPELLNVAGN